MKIKNCLFALVAAASQALPAAAQAQGTSASVFAAQPTPIAILIGLLLPAVQKVR